MFPADFTAFVVFYNVHAGKISMVHPCLEIICLTKLLKAQTRLVNYSIVRIKSSILESFVPSYLKKYNKQNHGWCKLARPFKTTDWEIS